MKKYSIGAIVGIGGIGSLLGCFNYSAAATADDVYGDYVMQSIANEVRGDA